MRATLLPYILGLVSAFGFSLPCAIAVISVYLKSGKPRALLLYIGFYCCLILKMIFLSSQSCVTLLLGRSTMAGAVVLELANYVVSVFLLFFLVLFVNALFKAPLAKVANAACAAACAFALANIFMPYSVSIDPKVPSLDWGSGLYVMDLVFYAGVSYSMIACYVYFDNVESGSLRRMLRLLLATTAVLIPFGVFEEFASLFLGGRKFFDSLKGLSISYPLFYMAFNAILLYQGLNNNLFFALGMVRVEPSQDFMDLYRINEFEQEVIRLAARGLSVRDIGETLVMPSRAVRRHLYNIFQKTGVSSRMELMNRILAFR